MGLVYWIHCNETGDNYIGSTIYLKKRMNEHRCKSNSSSSIQIINRGNYDVFTLEDNINEDILKVREQFYMDCCNDLINCNNAIGLNDEKLRKRLQYRKYRDKYISTQKEYQIKNREKLYTRTNCDCGGSYFFKNKSIHFKTKKHQLYLSL